MIIRIIALIFTLTLPSVTWAQAAYRMTGPYAIIARDGEYRNTKAGSERDMAQALIFAQQGDTAQACRIISAYATTLKRVEGHDAPLCTIQGYDLLRAMTLMRNHATGEWDAMVRNVWIPVLERFEADSPYANGNWGAIVNRMRMACGIYLQDSVIYKAAVDYFLHANDNGSLPHYISETGQCQETGRDQAHVQLGLEALAQTCEMAWEQGDDLWGAYDNRLMRGFEYCARYNLGYDVPFTTWQDCTGLYCDWREPGAMSRGKFWDIYRMPYEHYNGRKGLRMPFTRKVLKVLADKRQKERYERLSRQKQHAAYTHPAPQGAPLKHDYAVYVQPRGSKEWTKVDTYMAKVNARDTANSVTGHSISEISYAAFDFTGDVFVKVETKGRKFKSARIRPSYRGAIPIIDNDSTLHFLLFQPENVSVEIDGDIRHNLLIFTSAPVQPMEEAKREAQRQGRDFVYYGPGHYATDSILCQSNTTYYLAPGAYFTGTFAINDAENVSIIGRGTARPVNGYEGAHVYRSRNVLIDGLTLNTCPIGESHNVRLHDVRSISHPQWGDGLNVFGGCSDITFDRVFCRNSDDCTTVYATRKGFHGGVRNVRMSNSILWADLAHPVNIGLHGSAENHDSIQALVYDNIDILGQAENQIDYQGCLAINCGDNNSVRDVTFSNIRIEDITCGSLFHVKVCHNDKYGLAPGGIVEDVAFRTLRYYGAQPSHMSIISGYSPERMVRNVTFEDIRINGRKIYDEMPGKPRWYHTTDYLPCFVGPHVAPVRFLP